MTVSRKANSVSIPGLMLALFGALIGTFILNAQSFIASNAASLLGLLLMWMLSAAVIFIVLHSEKRPLASIGIKKVSGKEVLLAIIIGVLLSLTVPLLTLLSSQLISPSQEGGIASTTETTPIILLLLGVLTSGITEEILYRGYLLERISELTSRTWLAVVISVIAFVLPHLASWNLTHVVGVVLPLAIILSGLYLWKRSLIFTMIVHIVIDLPLVIIASMSSVN